jgi:hypothetical protein
LHSKIEFGFLTDYRFEDGQRSTTALYVVRHVKWASHLLKECRFTGRLWGELATWTGNNDLCLVRQPGDTVARSCLVWNLEGKECEGIWAQRIDKCENALKDKGWETRLWTAARATTAPTFLSFFTCECFSVLSG